MTVKVWARRTAGWWWGSEQAPPPPRIWPNADNTGVPAGTSLTAHTGATSFYSGTTTITDKTIAADIVVGGTATLNLLRCKLTGRVDVDAAGAYFTATDTEVNAGTWAGAAIGFSNITLLRCNVYGGENSVITGSNIDIRDSWLHGQYLAPTRDAHLNAFICNGGSNIWVSGCTLHAEPPDNGVGGGVSTNCSIFGDFAALNNITITDNLIKPTPGAYGVSLGYNPAKPHGTTCTNITFTDNRFERGTSGQTGVFGPVTGWRAHATNTFARNTYTDGAAVSPA